MEKRAQYSRWAAFEGAVLAKVKAPEECLGAILERQEEVDDESSESDLVTAHFRRQLQQAGLDADSCCVYIPTVMITEWIAAATGMKIAINKASSYLRALAIAELTYTKRSGVPGWVWRGPRAAKGVTPVDLNRARCLPE